MRNPSSVLPFVEKRTYSLMQFARRMGVTTETAHRWRINGIKAKYTSGNIIRPACFVAGKQWRITGQAANEFVAALTPAAPHEALPSVPPPPTRRRSATQERLEAYGF